MYFDSSKEPELVQATMPLGILRRTIATATRVQIETS
jgi:hypothetical protein